MKLTYHGHSCFLLDTGTHRLLFDPFLTGNPRASTTADAVACDFILISHGHDDHVGDARAIALRTGATIIANYEIATYLAQRGCSTLAMNHGGGHDFPFGRAKLTQAHHSSGYEEGGAARDFIYLGNPAGIVVTASGRNVYFAGDTCVFSDMQLIARMHPLDLALLPIGDTYTMGPDEALLALEFLRPKRAVPMHYDTFPEIRVDAAAFAARAAAAGSRVDVLQPGQTLDF